MGIGGVILGIVAIGCAFLAAFLFGTTGGIIAGVLGAAAVVLGFLKRKKDKKGGVNTYNGEFFHYGLAKLVSSLAKLVPTVWEL